MDHLCDDSVLDHAIEIAEASLRIAEKLLGNIMAGNLASLPDNVQRGLRKLDAARKEMREELDALHFLSESDQSVKH